MQPDKPGRNQFAALSSPSVCLLLCMFVAACSFAIFLRQTGDEGFRTASLTAFGVTEGRTDWRAFQNRLLGPYVVLAISRLGLGYASALVLVHFLVLTANAVAVFLLARRTGQDAKAALVWSGVFCFLFLFLQHPRLLVWDAIELLNFTLLSYLMLFGSRLWPLCLLFAVSILNRESGLFVALFLLIDSVSLPDLVRFRLRLLSRAKFVAGLACMAIGIAFVKLSRDLLFVATRGGTDDGQHAMLGNHLHVHDNLKDLLYRNWFGMEVLHTAPVVAGGLFLLSGFPGFSDAQRKTALLAFALMTGIVMFGVVNETRILLPLVPLFIFFSLSLAGREPPAAGSAGPG